MAMYLAALDAVRSDLDDGADPEAVLIKLKEAGLSQVECIRAVVDLGLSNRSEAKKLVHFSRAWSSTRIESEKLHERLEDLADESRKLDRG
ncbi:hypothetical protein [Streptomyces sp. NBC_01244]|uniref:hypothetical protein n=1 Tax=Streptomyces sp. NBC_01244 TaxID=2903797 RepID=UPI002E0F6FEE|nr:hypothetical protein OG247_29540 [Streptomyces sp. NBC_01244]